MSGAEVRKRYQADLRKASVEPPALEMASMLCTGCGNVTGMLRGEFRGPRVRRCDKCEGKQ